MTELPGAHGAPSFGPPLHLLVVALQIGHGWTLGSFAHTPPGQLLFVTHEKPARPLLVAALRDHRLAVCRAQGVPPFVVASDRTLREIAAVQPRTVEELMRVYGIGATKAARYGRGFLEVVARVVSPPA